jgi:hypothetical protein
LSTGLCQPHHCPTCASDIFGSFEMNQMVTDKSKNGFGSKILEEEEESV